MPTFAVNVLSALHLTSLLKTETIQLFHSSLNTCFLVFIMIIMPMQEIGRLSLLNS